MTRTRFKNQPLYYTSLGSDYGKALVRYMQKRHLGIRAIPLDTIIEWWIYETRNQAAKETYSHHNPAPRAPKKEAP